MNLCKYKNIFGEVGKGIHSYRIFNIAIVDLLFTVLVAYLIHRFLLSDYSLTIILIVLLLLGIIMHRLFCVRTTVDKLLFR